MLTRPIKEVNISKPAKLTVPRHEADKQIDIQLEKGKVLVNETINNEAEYDSVKSQFRIWSDFNKQLMAQIVRERPTQEWEKVFS